MKHECPNNPEHGRFVTTAHVMEEWVVDGDGNFKESRGCLETTHGPDLGNVWTCLDCEEEALAEKWRSAEEIEEVVLGGGLAVRVGNKGYFAFVILDENDVAIVQEAQDLDEGWKEKLLEALGRHGA